jgi:Carboxypeptidase regulatory-like domain
MRRHWHNFEERVHIVSIRRHSRILRAVLTGLLVGLAMPAWAQVDLGRVTGTVRDPQGAMVAGATVTVKNEKTGEERTATSNEEGFYLVTGLKASNYTIRVKSDKFAVTEYTELPLLPGQELPIDVELRPEGVTEAVTVKGDARTIDLSSARIGTNVIQREVNELPINGRQLSQLYLQAPGSLNSGTGTFGDIRFSGRAVEQNVIRYDGIEGSAIIDASPGNLNGELPSPFRLQSSLENVQEFRVESSNFPAEYGTGTGGQVTVVTKSGGNQIHGSAFEYYRSDKFDARNYFDIAKSPLKQHQYGGSIGAPILKDRTFIFGSYEGYRLDSGINFVEAVPSAAARARAVPAVQPLLDAFMGPGAVILPGASANPDFEIAQLQTIAKVRENAASVRLDHRFSPRWNVFGRYFTDRGKNDQPEGVTGRNSHIEANPSNFVGTAQGILSDTMLNEVRVGYNSAETLIAGRAPTVNGIDLSQITINTTGSIANTGIAGQGSSSGIAIPGGLLRQNSAANGRGTPYKPYSLSFIDTLSLTKNAHNIKFGGEVRLIRFKTDRLGGTTYTFANLNDFLANRAQSIQYLGDSSEPSVFNNGATGEREARQEYYIAYAQDEWKVSRAFTLNYGLRYEYYAPLREARNLDVLFDIDNGTLKDPATDFYESSNTNFQPRVGMTFAPKGGKTVLRGGFGIYVGPGQTEDQIQPIESDRISTTLTGGTFPIDTNALRANFINNPNNRTYQPRAYANDYKIPERIYQYSVSMQQELPYNMVGTVAYVGSQGRNLFLRSVANRITQVRTNPTPTGNAIIIREFDIVNADGSILRPFAEVDYKTSGGEDSYNALQTSLVRRFSDGLTLNAQYTFGKSYGNTAGSNEALTAANNARAIGDYDYDIGWNAFDVRHTFNLSALYSLPIGRGRSIGGGWSGAKQAVLGGWDVGAILNARSGLPVDVRITRPDVVYLDGAGNVFAAPAADRIAVINTPGGGASRNVRRPNLVPGVDPYIKDGLQWLNPAAFSTPAPGEFGNLQRGAIRGPGFAQLDLVLNKRFEIKNATNAEFRIEVFNLLDRDNFTNPVGTLPAVLGTGTNQLQPNVAFTPAAAGTFGRLTSTVGRTVGLGTNRQVQFAFRFNF